MKSWFNYAIQVVVFIAIYVLLAYFVFKEINWLQAIVTSIIFIGLEIICDNIKKRK